jgi:hypothetical protein
MGRKEPPGLRFFVIFPPGPVLIKPRGRGYLQRCGKTAQRSGPPGDEKKPAPVPRGGEKTSTPDSAKNAPPSKSSSPGGAGQGGTFPNPDAQNRGTAKSVPDRAAKIPPGKAEKPPPQAETGGRHQGRAYRGDFYLRRPFCFYRPGGFIAPGKARRFAGNRGLRNAAAKPGGFSAAASSDCARHGAGSGDSGGRAFRDSAARPGGIFPEACPECACHGAGGGCSGSGGSGGKAPRDGAVKPGGFSPAARPDWARRGAGSGGPG